MKRESRLALVCVSALALAACADRPATVTVHEPPRVTKLTVPSALLARCPKAREGLPDPATATNLDVAQFLILLAGRNDQCADQVDGLRAILMP